jgi:hypothetical protein
VPHKQRPHKGRLIISLAQFGVRSARGPALSQRVRRGTLSWVFPEPSPGQKQNILARLAGSDALRRGVRPLRVAARHRISCLHISCSFPFHILQDSMDCIAALRPLDCG